MKLADLREEEEYAAHSWVSLRSSNSYFTPPFKVRFVRLAQYHNGRNNYHVCIVEVLERPIQPAEIGMMLELEPRYIWRIWAEQEQIEREASEKIAAREANVKVMRKALEVLGLHWLRRMHTDPDLGNCQTTLSGAELIKIADAVTEVERLVLNWYSDGSDRGTPADGALYRWADAHDFSHLEAT